MKAGKWQLTFTPRGNSGREIGRFASRDDAMIAGEAHFERTHPGEDEDWGWQMSFNGATALTVRGVYRVRKL
jgi:hypothetical protein